MKTQLTFRNFAQLNTFSAAKWLAVAALTAGLAACGDDAVVETQAGTDATADVDAAGLDGQNTADGANPGGDGDAVVAGTDDGSAGQDGDAVNPGTDDGSAGEDGDAANPGTDDGSAGVDGDAVNPGTDDGFVGGDGDDANPGTDDGFVGVDGDASNGGTDGSSGSVDGDASNGGTDDALVGADGDVVATPDGVIGGGDIAAPQCSVALDCAVVGAPPPGACKAFQCVEGKCVVGNGVDGTPCDDGDVCTAGDSCAAGVCAPGKSTCQCKNDAACNDNNGCTDDKCDLTSNKCVYGNNTAACTDSNACTDGDICGGGACVPGKAKVCDDSNLCTSDSCDAVSGACVNLNNFNVCDDGNACTDGDACAAGKCASGKAKVCDDGNVCTDEKCDTKLGCQVTNNTAACKLDDKCVTESACKDAKCTATKKIACDDANPCTNDTCDAATGVCNFGANAQPCEDGNGCTTGDLCQNGKCNSGPAKVCDDKNVCTADSCDKVTGNCVFANVATPCDDGNPCTDGDVCGGGLCTPGKVKTCDDANTCTDDTCDSKAGCTNVNNTAGCSLNDKCQLGTCAVGKCVASGAKGCDDANVCTADTCDPIKGCVYTPVADKTNCGKADLCTADSLCTAGKCTVGAKTDCSDGNPCTNDSCDPLTGCKWTPNNGACEDGDKCTSGEKCGANGKCAGGVAIDIKTVCDDANLCTTDGCVPATGCSHTNNVLACDDANVCTVGETCAGGNCQGGKLANCDDGKECTVDACDAKTGGCSWTAKIGSCNDGDACTTADYCKNTICVSDTKKSCDDSNACTTDSCAAATGNCVNTAVADGLVCDDGNFCTDKDACAAGKCAGAANALKCDDGNVCTNDACDPKTGKCAATPNTAPCDNGDKCTYGDKCDGKGVCITGGSQVCNDGTTCTTDACDPATGKCTFTAIADNTPCDDGVACTTESLCKVGKCTVTKSDCKLYTDALLCADAAKGWTLDKPQGKAVIWAVDQLPVVTDQAAHECTLNLNNNVNYCDVFPNFPGACYNPTGTAASPTIDATKAFGVPTLLFQAWYQVDGNNNTDIPQVIVRDTVTNAVLYTFTLNIGANFQGIWRDLVLPIPTVAGKSFRLEFSLANAWGGNGNVGKGYFIDNIVVQEVVQPEICNDAIDNDGNGLIDCADKACVGQPNCVEICNDGIDNDYDDKIDCADSDCTSNSACIVPFVKLDFNCGDVDWTYSAPVGNNVTWAIDATPASVAPKTGACTMNFNNGTTYCTNQNCNDNNPAAIGTATYNPTVDASIYKTVAMQAWFNINVENGNGNWDHTYFEVSTDGFKCTQVQGACPSQNNPYTANNLSTEIAKDPQHAWTLRTINLNTFAGKKFTMRLRFNSVDGQNNDFPGPFVDDLRLYGL